MTGLHTEISGVYDITVVRFTASHADREVLRAVTARDLVEHAATNGALRDALETFAPPRSPNDLPSAKTLSRVLGKFRGRVIDGRALAHAAKTRGDVQLWAVERVGP